MKLTTVNDVNLKAGKTPPERLPFHAGTKNQTAPYSQEEYEKELVAVMTPIEKRLWDNYMNAPSAFLQKMTGLCEKMIQDNCNVRDELDKILHDHKVELERMDEFQRELTKAVVKAYMKGVGNKMEIYKETYALVQEYAMPDWNY